MSPTEIKERLNLPDPWDRKKPNVPVNNHGWFTDPKKKPIEKLFKEHNIKTVLEIGSWMGQSALWFADRCDFIVCVDTWLGNDHFFTEERLKVLLPTVYETFLVNCWGKKDKIFPVRLQSHVGLWYMASKGIEFDAVYIDADHHYAPAKMDMEFALKLPGKPLLFGDDYIKEFANQQSREIRFPVQKAVKEVFGDKAHNEGTTWWVYGEDSK